MYYISDNVNTQSDVIFVPIINIAIWSDKMVERVHNVIKRDNKQTKQAVDTDEPSTPKVMRSKKDTLSRR